jgi:hypothetical protein
MIARTLGFSRADLLDMPFDELCLVWLPEVERLQMEEGE